MLQILIYIVIPKLILAQMNGEFWWLNSELKKLHRTEAPKPEFEVLNQFDTDESAKIIFRDEDFDPRGEIATPEVENKETKRNKGNFKTASNTWPNNLNPNKDITKLVSDDELMELENIPIKHGQRPVNDDLFVFKFPDDDSKHVEEKPKIIPTVPVDDMIGEESKLNNTNIPRNTHKDTIVFQFPEHSIEQTQEIDPEKKTLYIPRKKSVSFEVHKNNSENICSYIKKSRCFESNGIVYELKKSIDHHPYLICCILPSPTEKTGRIVFPDSNLRTTKRLKRSNKVQTSLNQRDFILKQRLREKISPTASNIKIVTPDDEYVDPYWNIKTHNLKSPTTQSIIKQECNYQDYDDDYEVELPKPGLVGLYSDQGVRPPGGWTYQNDYGKPVYDSVEDEDDDTPLFGYSTVDPRRVSSSKVPKRGRPVKLTTSAPEVDSYNIGSQTVNFQSNPNFQALQGFKLLNLARDKSTLYTKNPRGTTETINDDDGKEAANIESDTHEDGGGQVYEYCGKFEPVINARNNKQIGEAEVGSYPWLAVAVLSRRPLNILCYTTIVHPRAAITAGDCVSSYATQTSTKEVIIVAGLRDAKDRTSTQNRFVTIQLHPQYRRDNLANNLALLHWQSSLRLNSHVQPACLASGSVGNDCKFFGWGGFDQAMRQHPRWQRASTLSAQDCLTRFSKTAKLPKDAFCAAVQTRGTVTGIGGSLICNLNGRASATGVAVYRDNVLVLIPAQEWILKALEDLNIE